MSFLQWLAIAAPWLYVAGYGGHMWNSALQSLPEARRHEFTVMFRADAFDERGKVLRRKAVRFFGVGIPLLAIYFAFVWPWLGPRLG